MRVLLFFLLSYGVYSQTGEWIPKSADTSYPRTLLRASDTSSIISWALTDTTRFQLWQGIYGSAIQLPPIDNSQDASRRQRSTIAKNAAFILMLNRKPQAGTLVQLSSLEHVQLREKIRDLLDQTNTDVEAISITNPSAYDSWQWRSKELIDLLCAYDMLLGSGERIQDDDARLIKLQTFSANLYTQASAKLFGQTFFGVVKNNHALMTAAALGMSAVVLSSATSTTPNYQPSQWIGTSLFIIDNVLWRDAQRQSDADVSSGYSEGPYYFRYAMLNCLPFFRALSHYTQDSLLQIRYNDSLRQIRHPYFDSTYDRLYEWAYSVAQPDGSLASVGDTYVDTGFPELCLSRKGWTIPLINKRRATQNLQSQLVSTVDMRSNYLCTNTRFSPAHTTRLSSPEAGLLILRQDTTTPSVDAPFFLLRAANGRARSAGAGHSQSDATSFLFSAFGQPLILDPGYIKYTRRSEVGAATNHNVILIDNEGPPNGSPGVAGGADAFIDNSFSFADIHFARVRTQYNGASITRDVYSLDNQSFAIADAVVSPATHRFTWQLHGNGLLGGNAVSGTAALDTSSSRIRTFWRRHGVVLQTHLAASPPSYIRIDSAVHEEAYDKSASHSVVRAQTPITTSAAYCCYFRADTVDKDAAMNTQQLDSAITLSSTESGSARILFVNRSLSVRQIRAENYRISSNATSLLLKDKSHNIQLCCVAAGMTELRTEVLDVSSNKRINIALLSDEGAGAIYRCYVSQACELRLQPTVQIPEYSYAIDYAKGANVERFLNDKVSLKEAGEFVFGFRTVGVSDEALSARQVFPLPCDTHVSLRNTADKNIVTRLVDCLGIVRAEQLSSISGLTQFSTAHLVNGWYKLESSDGSCSMILVLHE